MSTLIPSMTYDEFQKLTVDQKRELKTVEITDEGEYLFTAVIPHGDSNCRDYIRTQAEYLGLKANIPGGKDPAELASLPDEPILPVKDILERKRAAMAKARAAKSTLRETVGV